MRGVLGESPTLLDAGRDRVQPRLETVAWSSLATDFLHSSWVTSGDPNWESWIQSLVLRPCATAVSCHGRILLTSSGRIDEASYSSR